MLIESLNLLMDELVNILFSHKTGPGLKLIGQHKDGYLCNAKYLQL